MWQGPSQRGQASVHTGKFSICFVTCVTAPVVEASSRIHDYLDLKSRTSYLYHCSNLWRQDLTMHLKLDSNSRLQTATATSDFIFCSLKEVERFLATFVLCLIELAIICPSGSTSTLVADPERGIEAEWLGVEETSGSCEHDEHRLSEESFRERAHLNAGWEDKGSLNIWGVGRDFWSECTSLAGAKVLGMPYLYKKVFQVLPHMTI